MGVLKITSAVLAVIALSLLVVGGLGFSGMAAERGVNVAVVSDENAFVGYDASDIEVNSGDRVDLVTVTNRLQGDIEVESVTISGEDGLEVSDVSKPSIDSGDAESIQGNVTCQTPTTTDIEVTVGVAGNSVSVKLFGDSRSFNVSCSPGQGHEANSPPDFVPPTDSGGNESDTDTQHGVWFTGSGNAVVYHENDSVEVQVWGYEADDGDRATTEVRNVTKLAQQTVTSGDLIRGQIPSSSGATIVAVTLVEEDTSYVHPEFSLDSESFDGDPSTGWGDIKSIDTSSWEE